MKVGDIVVQRCNEPDADESKVMHVVYEPKYVVEYPNGDVRMYSEYELRVVRESD